MTSPPTSFIAASVSCRRPRCDQLRHTTGISVALTALLLAGCLGTVRPAETARYDLGGPTDMAQAGVTASVATVAVAAPSWLAGNALQYRLLYADAARRHSYVESRWAAPPAELLEQLLDRRLTHAGGRCRLQVELDELAQVFDTPDASRVVLEGRAVLSAGRDRLGVRPFALAPPSPSADARGGVAGAAVAARLLADDLARWLAGFTDRCRN